MKKILLLSLIVISTYAIELKDKVQIGISSSQFIIEYDLSEKSGVILGLNTYITSLMYKFDFHQIEKQNYFLYAVGYRISNSMLFGGGAGIEYPIKIEEHNVNIFATIDIINRVFDAGLKYRLEL